MASSYCPFLYSGRLKICLCKFRDTWVATLLPPWPSYTKSNWRDNDHFMVSFLSLDIHIMNIFLYQTISTENYLHLLWQLDHSQPQHPITAYCFAQMLMPSAKLPVKAKKWLYAFALSTIIILRHNAVPLSNSVKI